MSNKRNYAFLSTLNRQIMKHFNFLASIALCWGLLASAQAQIILPAEVIGAEGAVEQRNVTLTSGQAQAATGLWMQVNNLSYDNKGSVRVNDGAWVNLTNSNISCEEPDRSYGGIGGGFSTIRFTVPVSGFRTGSNTVRFRFNTSDGVSVGYRVVRFNVVNAEGDKLLTSGSFRDENPGQWQPFYISQSAINEGKNLWYNAPLNDHYLTDKQPIQARCGDCHAQDGRDLKYFQYSNKSIVERAKFHGLSEEQGKKIASYIRTLPTPAPARARPWNPPYQPGPGTDNRPVAEWAAGAGLDAVLAKDADMKSYLFPEGTSPAALAQMIETNQTLNIREIPIAVQFPDWKHWLPLVHPFDVWGEDAFKNGEAWQGYTELLADLDKGLGQIDNLMTTTGKFERKVTDFIGKGRRDRTTPGSTINSGDPWRIRRGDNMPYHPDSRGGDRAERERAKLSLAQWLSVKHWEIMQEYELEDKASQYNNKLKGFAEKYTWLSSERAGVWYIAPHMIADNLNEFAGQNRVIGKYFSNIWYQLQMTLNASMRQKINVSPVDWPYQQRHINELAIEANVPEPMRFVQTNIKAYQNRDNLHVYRSNEPKIPKYYGWQLRITHPWWLYSDQSGDMRGGLSTLDDIESGLWVKTVDAFLKEWLEVVSKLERPTEWNRTENCETGKWDKLQPVDCQPHETDPWSMAGNSDRLFYFPENWHLDNFYKLIPRFQQIGVNQALINELIDWCKEAWPMTNWDQFRTPGNLIQGISLVDETTGEPYPGFALLEDRAVYKAEDFPQGALNLYALVSGRPGSVVFEDQLNGVTKTHIENAAPYALQGNLPDFTTWQPTPGAHRITVKTYAQAGGSGALIAQKTTRFTVVAAPSSDTWYAIKNRWRGQYLLDGGDQVTYGTPDLSDQTAHWQLENVEQDYYRLKNRATGHYLHIQRLHAYAEATSAASGWFSGQWQIHYLDDSYVQLQCRWGANPDFLHVQNQRGYAQHASDINPSWHSAQWELIPVGGGNIRTMAQGSKNLTKQEAVRGQMVVYPNPSAGLVQVSGVEGRVVVYNLMGIKISETMATEGKAVFDLSGRTGIYLVRTARKVQKIIIK